MNTPEILHFQVTERCNLSCPGCYLPGRDGGFACPDAAARRVFEPLAASGARFATITGGEPLLHPRLGEICAAASGLFTEVQVVTNGLLLDAAAFAMLRDAGVGAVRVSLDGAGAATHDALRGLPGAFARTLANLRALAALPPDERGGVKLGVIATVGPANAPELAATARLALELGCDHFLAQPLHGFGRVYPPPGEASAYPGAAPEFPAGLDAQVAELSRIKAARPDFVDNSFEMLSAMRDFFARPGGPSQRCGADRFVFVDSALAVRGCLFCAELGSLAQASPAEIFASARWRDFQAFRRSCTRCLMGCQFRGRARRLADAGFAAWNAGRYEAAARLFEASFARERSAEALQGLGMSLASRGRAGRAEAIFRQVLALSPGHEFALCDLASCLEAQGRAEEALELLGGALRGGRAGQRTLARYAGALSASGRHQDAADALEQAVRSGRALPEVRHRYAVALMALGRAGEALAQLELALAARPGDAWTRFDYGMALRALGRPGEALGHFRAAMQAAPSVPWFPYRLGLTLEELGRPGEAIELLKLAVRLAPGEARPRLELARLLACAGDPEAARPAPAQQARQSNEG